jgi:hypothetical protein
MWRQCKKQGHRLALFQFTWAVAAFAALLVGAAFRVNAQTELGEFGQALIDMLGEWALIIAILVPGVSALLFWGLGQVSMKLSKRWATEAHKDAAELANDAISVGYNTFSFAAAVMFVLAVLNIDGKRPIWWGYFWRSELYDIIVLALVLVAKDMWDAWVPKRAD